MLVCKTPVKYWDVRCDVCMPPTAPYRLILGGVAVVDDITQGFLSVKQSGAHAQVAQFDP